MNDLQHAEHREFAPTCSDVGFRIPEDTDPRSKKPKQDDPGYAAKLMLHNAFCSERDVWSEIKAVRTGFSTVVSAVSQAYGQDFFSYVQKHWKNLEVRRKYEINTPEGYTLYDSSLKEPWNASLVLAALDKQFRTMGAPSSFAKKAHADLLFRMRTFVPSVLARLMSSTHDLSMTSSWRSLSLISLDLPSRKWASPWNKLAALLKLHQRTLPLERWLVRQNKSLIPVHQWRPTHQKALPLERYLV